MTVLVTGSTGCLGRHLVVSLVDSGVPIRALVQETSRTDHLERLGVEVRRGSLTSEDDLRAAVKDVEVVYHLGGIVVDDPTDTSEQLWQALHRTNVEGTERLARHAASAGTRRFVFCSSVRIFGFGNQMLWPEDGPRTASDLYSRAKAMAEEALDRVAKDTGLEVIHIRPRFIYGDGDRYVLPKLVKQVRSGWTPLVGGDAICDVVFARDCVQALRLAADKGVPGSAYNITSGECLSVREVLGHVAEALGRPVRFVTPPAADALAHAAAVVPERPPLLDRQGPGRARLSTAVHLPRRPARDRPPSVPRERRLAMPSIGNILLPPVLRYMRWRADELLKRTTREPERYQREALLRILAANADTTYGREHSFAKLRSVEDFRRAVPINTYEELRPYIDRVADGTDPHAITADDVEMFTNTSGTTSKPKLIPVTKSGRLAERRVKNAWVSYLARDHPRTLTGKAFYLFNNAEEYRTPSQRWVGSNAGLMYRNSNAVFKSMQAVPYEVCLVKDYASRYYVILRHILEVDVTMLACINPSSTLLLAELANQHAESLIRDIYAGTLRDGLDMSADLYAFFRGRLRPNRPRGRALARLAAAHGKLRPADFWPNLGVLTSWKGASVRIFIEKCREWYGTLPTRDVGYGSSEFRTGLCVGDEGSPNVPLPDNYFYEFVPEEDRERYLAGEKALLGLGDLEQGKRYLIVQTGPHGLYRYNIEDIIEVNGFYQRTPTIHFVQKARMVTSITGEKIYESQVIEAMERVAARQPELKPSFFICYCDAEAANYKVCVEFPESRSQQQLADLLRLFEEALGEVNIEYPYKRASLRLKDPEIFQLKHGESLRFIQYIGKRSIQDNQAKIPRLSRDVDEHFKLFGLERKITHA
jgi:nucleoside-diphosphate-sugar epimerase